MNKVEMPGILPSRPNPQDTSSQGVSGLAKMESHSFYDWDAIFIRLFPPQLMFSIYLYLTEIYEY